MTCASRQSLLVHVSSVRLAERAVILFDHGEPFLEFSATEFFLELNDKVMGMVDIATRVASIVPRPLDYRNGGDAVRERGSRKVLQRHHNFARSIEKSRLIPNRDRRQPFGKRKGPVELWLDYDASGFVHVAKLAPLVPDDESFGNRVWLRKTFE